MSETVEYRVRPVTRYVVTCFRATTNTDLAGVSEQRGEYDNKDTAHAVAYALAKADHERLGYPPGDERVRYPVEPELGANGTQVSLSPIGAFGGPRCATVGPNQP